MKLLRMISKIFLFVAIFIIGLVVIPYRQVADLFIVNMRMETAIAISQALLGEIYPETYEFVSDLIILLLNIPVSITVYILIMMVLRRFMARSESSKETPF